ncbi:hypothetical protein ACFQQB_01840 [Nonomuraea rubra]|uniref:hypothetical protein n=1 Tax=Nonomuraea rubra TaxID=46180 RepID=UPI003618C696
MRDLKIVDFLDQLADRVPAPGAAPRRPCTRHRPPRCSAWWPATPPARSTPATPRPSWP